MYKLNYRIIEVLIVCLITGIFIYYRKLDYYKTMPRKSLYVSLLVFIWSFLVLVISPWFLPIGLLLLNVFGFKKEF